MGILLNKTYNDTHLRRLLGKLFHSSKIVLNKALLLQEVHGRIANNRKLRKDKEVNVLLLSKRYKALHLFKIAGNITNGWVYLGHSHSKLHLFFSDPLDTLVVSS